MAEEKSGIYAIIAACVIGIFIVGFFVITYTPITVDFSELYFEEHERLPRVISAGNKEEFTFTVDSHRKDTTSYGYLVTLNDKIVDEGSFTIPPDGNITINASVISEKPSLTFVRNLTVTESSHLIASAKDTGVGLVPIEVPMTDWENSNTIVISLDPNAEEFYSFESDRKEPFGDILKKQEKKESLEPQLTDAGINLINYNITVHNNAGDILITHKKLISEYRYEFKNVSVTVTSEDEENYGIYFWTVVV